MTLQHPYHLRVAIIGGGFSGASLAWQLAEGQVPVRIAVIEPRAELGRGLAYSTTEPTHRINVPAQRMTIDPENRADFLDWLTEAERSGRLRHDPASVTAEGERFPRREVFGRYVAERLDPHLQSGRIRHHRARVADIGRGPEGSYDLMLSNERRIRADILVLATGHPATALPRALAGLNGAAQLVTQADDVAGLARLDRAARVLIIGAGLSAADAIATLDRLGHRGPITCLSRHGLRARGHHMVTQGSEADFTQPPSLHASALVRRVRDAVAAAAAQGQSWQAIFHRLREQGPQIWAALDEVNRARLLRHLRSFWDVHRYRLAPQVEAVQDRLIAKGQLEFRAGRLVASGWHGGAVRIGWRPRGSHATRQADYDLVINTTGPAHARAIAENPALSALTRMGLIMPDPMGLGIDTTMTFRAVDATGRANPRILIAGPLARGHIGELVGAPECAAHAGLILREIARQAQAAPILRPAANPRGASATPS